MLGLFFLLVLTKLLYERELAGEHTCTEDANLLL
jgi:hypothetical protein